VKYRDVQKRLKSDCGLEYGHANAIIPYMEHPEVAKRRIAADAKKET